MPVRSLFDLASQACIKNVRHIDSIGDFLPYENVRHVLLRIDSAQQLRRIELNSPQLDGRTGEVWLKLIEKDFPMEFRSRAYKPQNPSKWYKVWEKYKRDHDEAIEESERKLKNALAGLQQDREKNTSRIVERKLLPRKGATGPRRGPRDHSGSSLNFASGSRTSTKTGASVMRKVRREVKEIASIHGGLSKTIGAPQRQTQISKAPQSMINEHRRATQPSYEPAKKPPKVAVAVREHEDRATFISDSEDGDDDDQLFDEPPKKRPATAPAPKPTSGGARKSAQASLLKTRPAVPAASRPIKDAQGSKSAEPRARIERISTSRSGSNVSPTKDSPRPSERSRAPSSSRPTTSPQKPPPSPGLSPRAASSPPLPEESVRPSAGSAPSRPPKRKAVDIFMRPKKRSA